MWQSLNRRAHRPWDLLLYCAAALILISVARLHTFIPAVASLRPGLLVLIVGLGALFHGYRRARRLHYLKNPLGFLMAFFVVWCTLGVPFALYQGRAFGAVTEGLWVEALVILIMVSAIRGIEDFKRLLAVFGFGAAAYAFMAQGAGSRSIGGGGYDANDAAMFIVSAIPLIFFFLVKARKLSTKVLFGVGIAGCGSAVVLSGSRGGFLGLVAVLLYSLFFLKGIQPVWRVVVVAVAIVVVGTQADAEYWDRMETITSEDDYNRSSYTGRMEIWKRGIGYTIRNPIFGVGVSNFTFAEGTHPEAIARLERGRGVKFSAPHSIWIQTSAETGFPGFIAFAAMFLVAFRVLWSVDSVAPRSLRASADLAALRELSRPLMGVLIGVVITGSFLSRAYSSVVWMPLGLSLCVLKLMRLKENELRLAARKGQVPGSSSRRRHAGKRPDSKVAVPRRVGNAS